MIRYTPENQLSIEEFKKPFQNSLSVDNRWVKLSKLVPWDKFAVEYISMMNSEFGRPGTPPRVVLGALIIKHKENLDDRGVIEAIQENVYMQYFLGLSEFSTKPVFDPSLFVKIRQRVGADIFDTLNVDLIQSISEKADTRHLEHHKKKNDGSPTNKGKMQADATVADQYITYPTDSGLLNSSRKQTQKIIDFLYEANGKKGVKPRTYRKNLDQAFLNYSKKKKKAKKAHRKMTRTLLESVRRNLRHIDEMLDIFEGIHKSFPLSQKDQRILWVVQHLYQQQKTMFDTKTHSHPDRLVSIHQPHVRAIPRGKTKAQIEFGSKLGVSLDQGFARINTFSWDAYHEGKDLIAQTEAYKELHGYYPDLVLVDKAYATRENRKWLKENNIRITAAPLGRKKKIHVKTNYQKRKNKQEAAERNHIEGKFGQAKNGYRLNQIRAKLRETSESWVSCVFFIMNLINYQKKVLFCSFLTRLNAVFLSLYRGVFLVLKMNKENQFSNEEY
jgi:hypothetical protein